MPLDYRSGHVLSLSKDEASRKMLEPLVSSRIRRTLFEYLLTHPDARFYLRGVARELGLSVTPLRRELKRLERSGTLRAVQEGNILFYTVNTASQVFLQLQHVSLSAIPSEAGSIGVRIGTGLAPLPVAAPTPFMWRSPLSGPALVGAAGVGIALMLIAAGLFYLTTTHQRLMSQASRALKTRKAEVTVVVPPHASSGAMRGKRWHIIPGGFGGFSTGASDESY